VYLRFNMSLAFVYLLTLTPTAPILHHGFLMEARAQAALFRESRAWLNWPRRLLAAQQHQFHRAATRGYSLLFDCAPRLPHEGPCAGSPVLRVACAAQSATPLTRPSLAVGCAAYTIELGTRTPGQCPVCGDVEASRDACSIATALLVDLRLIEPRAMPCAWRCRSVLQRLFRSPHCPIFIVTSLGI
jgi:hypothetical protein